MSCGTCALKLLCWLSSSLKHKTRTDTARCTVHATEHHNWWNGDSKYSQSARNSTTLRHRHTHTDRETERIGDRYTERNTLHCELPTLTLVLPLLPDSIDAKVKGQDIYTPPLIGKPEQLRFTMRCGVLTSVCSRQRSAISGHP